jgi:hypothetical protein
MKQKFCCLGTALEAMDYHVENLPNDLSKIIVKQNGKFISKSFLRVIILIACIEFILPKF